MRTMDIGHSPSLSSKFQWTRLTENFSVNSMANQFEKVSNLECSKFWNPKTYISKQFPLLGFQLVLGGLHRLKARLKMVDLVVDLRLVLA